VNEDFKAVFELRDINLKLKAILGEKNLSKFFASGRMPHNLGNSPSIITYELGFGKGRNTCILVYHNLSFTKG